MSSARRLNDGMGEYVAHQVIKHMNLEGGDGEGCEDFDPRYYF